MLHRVMRHATPVSRKRLVMRSEATCALEQRCVYRISARRSQGVWGEPQKVQSFDSCSDLGFKVPPGFTFNLCIVHVRHGYLVRLRSENEATVGLDRNHIGKALKHIAPI
jgi:hypothetical protein